MSNEKPKTICKFRPINKHTEDIFCKKKIFFGKVEDFNDPFEFSMNVPNQSIAFNSFKNAFVVFSAVEEAKKYDVLLWSHYADFHRGICIEFTPNYNNAKSPFHELLKVQYSDYVPENKARTLQENQVYMEKILITKAKSWEFEKEWRVVKLKHAGDRVEEPLSNGFNIDRGRLHNFEPAELSKVIIGCNASKNDERIVLNWIEKLGNNDIKVEKCYINEKEYKLKFEQII